MTGLYPGISTPGTDLVAVTMMSGKPLNVPSHEAQWWNETRDSYHDETRFTETTDLRDLDRVLVHELMIFRWTQHLASGVDYEGVAIDAEQLRRNIKEYSDQLTKIKEAMGLTKRARNDAANDGNLNAYITELKARARIFGIHRENQLSHALVLLQDLFTIVGAYDRSDAEERTKLGFESETEILNWIREDMRPKFDAIDEHFRTNEQRYWVRDL